MFLSWFTIAGTENQQNYSTATTAVSNPSGIQTEGISTLKPKTERLGFDISNDQEPTGHQTGEAQHKRGVKNRLVMSA